MRDQVNQSEWEVAENVQYDSIVLCLELLIYLRTVFCTSSGGEPV